MNSREMVKVVTLNLKDTGYRGIWYMNQPSDDEYAFKYSGGLGTYPANHQPFAVYCKEVDKTFFCYGGTTENSHTELLHMVSYYDHRLGVVPRPTILLNKQTNDAHDNPVLSVDARGYIWIFSTSHGESRPSYIHRSVRPYDIDEFEIIRAVKNDGDDDIAVDNFSYMQVWSTADNRFLCFFTKYNYPVKRTLCFMSSEDGVRWSEWQRLAAIDEGHYQTSALGKHKAGSAFNYHPDGLGLNHRTNLYYIETTDGGNTWVSADGTPLGLPLTAVSNAALVRDYESEGLKVYINDVTYDEYDHPVILYVTSKGYESGPENGPRVWNIAHWLGNRWAFHIVTSSESNYDMGSIYVEDSGLWRVIGPTEPGPQRYNPGGEVAMWVSEDRGVTWTKACQMTSRSTRNHTYVRRPVNAHPDFYALWADGHARQVSGSNLYFCNRKGDVMLLPHVINEEPCQPTQLTPTDY